MFVLRVSTAGVAMVVLLWLVSPNIDVWLAWGRWERIGKLTGIISAAGALYGVVLLGMGIKPREFVLRTS